MTLLEATRWIKDKYNLEMAPNTLRKACASFRLKATRIGESNTHIRRTQWDVSVDDLINFLQKEYHPRPKSKGRKSSVKQLPKKRNIFDLVDLSLNTKGKFRVVEHIFQAPLSLYGVDLEKYDTEYY